MIYLTFDSNIWIYLLDNSWSESNPLDYLEHWLTEKQIKILVPEIIITEWNSHKDEEKAKRIKKLREFFDMASDIIPSGFIQDQNKPENLSWIVDGQFQRIENIIHSLCERVQIDQSIQLKAVQWGIEKKAPMHRKSSMADTLIVLSLLEFAVNYPDHEFYFISNNVDDFYEKQNNKTEIHPHLRDHFLQRNIKAYRHLEHLIHELKGKLPVTMDIESIKQDRLKAKLEQQIYNPVVSASLTGTRDGYLDNTNTIDQILANDAPTTQQIMFVLNLVESDDSYAYHFYKNCKKIFWFQILIDRGSFLPRHNPPTVKTVTGYNTPGWWPMLYLLTLAGDPAFDSDAERCKQLTGILEEICKHPKDNSRTWYFMVLIIEKIPNQFMPESLLNYIPVWLSENSDNSMVSAHLCQELLNKFLPDHPTEDDNKKAQIIMRLLFSLRRKTSAIRADLLFGQYYSPVYEHYLSGIALDNNLIRRIVTASGDAIILYLIKNFRKLLHDYPEGITTTFQQGGYQYTIKALIEDNDVIVSSKREDIDSEFQSTRVVDFAESDESSFIQTLIDILHKQGITSIEKDTKDYALKMIRIALFHGNSYSIDTAIHKLESSGAYEDELLAIFTVLLTKLLMEYGRQLPSAVQDLLQLIWNQEHLPGIRRVILFVIGEHWETSRKLFWTIIRAQGGLFSDHVYEKEIYHLLKINAGSYTAEDKNLLNELIDKGPQEDGENEDVIYADNWKFKWYSALKDDPDFKSKYELFSLKLNMTDERFENLGEVRVRVGTISPLSTEEILRKSNEEIVDFIRHFNRKDRWEEPTIEGMAERLSKAVEKEPSRFASEIHLYKDANFSYVYYMLNGFQEAWKNKFTFDWAKVLQFCKEYISQESYHTGKLQASEDRWSATNEWVAGSIANLLTYGMQADERSFDIALLPLVKDILIQLGMELQLPKNQKQEITDYPTYSLNSTAGKVLRALFDYSLRRARNNFKFEDTDKWEQDVKALFEETTQKGLIDGYILQGMYFEQFYYLDKDWIRRQLEINIEVDDAKWMAFMGGLVFGKAPWSKEIYLLTYPHYEKAIQNKVEFSKMNERTMVRHLVAFYFWGYETLDDHRLIYQFLQLSTSKMIGEFVEYAGRQESYYKSLEPPKKTEFEDKIMAVWRMVAEKYKGANTDGDKKTLASLENLLTLAPHLSSEVTELTLESVKGMTEYYHWHGVIENLLSFAEKDNDEVTASNVGRILLAATTMPLYTDYEADKLKKLVTYLFENRQRETASDICDRISRQGHSFLRDIYNKYRNS